MTRSPPFRETQQLRSPWLWGLLCVVAGVLVLSGAWLGVAILLPVAVLLFVARLRTDVRTDGVYLRFTPFHRSDRKIPFDEIERVEPTEFGLLTYGGVGIRWTANTIAYMTTSGSGVKLHRTNSKSVVIGSNDAEKLLQTIEQQAP